MAFWDDLWSSTVWIQRLRRFVLLMILFGMVPGLLALLLVRRTGMWMLFKRDIVTHMATVELWVVLIVVMLVIRFLVDFFGPWYANRFMARIVNIIDVLNYSMVHYSMGLMQLSATRVNDFFQVWAVLLVTLQHSVQTGRPYSRSKQIPLLDLMSSFWAANLIRVQAFFLLRFLLWFIWTINAVRIIYFFISADKSKEVNRESTRLVADYMRYEHKLGESKLSGATAPPAASDPAKDEFPMKEYKFIVRGEDEVLQDLQDGLMPDLQDLRRVWLGPNKLVTVDKIWQDTDAGKNGLMGCTGNTADKGNRLKDVCLSFALYKLLSRRFYDLPIHEALPQRVEKLRRLVFRYICQDTERAFRVMATELSFVQDMFYSKHAALFAGGFPTMHLMLSLLLIVATGYISYPVRSIPERMDEADRDRITRGVFITHVIVVLIIGKELAEIYLYVFSQWTKVLLLCNYVRHHWFQHPLVEMVLRELLHFMTRGSWDENIRQHNLLTSIVAVSVPRYVRIFFPSKFTKFPRGIKMEECTKQAIFQSLKRLEKKPERLGSYFSNAFPLKESFSNDFGVPDQDRHKQLLWAVKLEGDTHRILVWHIATCLCEIDLVPEQQRSTLMPILMQPGPLFKKMDGDPNELIYNSARWEHYTTAASLSNYCVYLVTQALVPDSGLVSRKVYGEVVNEVIKVTVDPRMTNLLKRRSMRDVFDHLKKIADNADEAKAKERGQAQGQGKPDEEAPAASEHLNKTERSCLGTSQDIRDSLTEKGAMLWKQLSVLYEKDREGLWEKLATFWTGFLLHLASSTRASKHRVHLAGNRELTTHLWALLSHAGFLGNSSHGQELLDPENLEDADAGLEDQSI